MTKKQGQGCKPIFSIAIAGAVTALFARPVLAWSPTQSDLIVRMNSPVYKESVVSKILDALPTDAPKMHIINKKEGLVQFRFSNAVEAEIAKKVLISSGAVHSAVPNFLYHPEVFYQARPAGQLPSPPEGFWKQGVNEFERFEKMIFEYEDHDLTTVSTLPAVALPPSSIQAGVDADASQDLSMAQIDMPSAELVSQFQLGLQPVTVAVIDTGIDYNHEDLSGAMWRNPTNPQIVGYDFAHHNNLPFDVRHFDMNGCLEDPSCYLGINSNSSGDPGTTSQNPGSPYLTNPGHGTHCAGHIGAVANNSLGIRGTGGNVQVMALKFVHDVGEPDAGEGDDVAAIQSIDYAIKNGAKIINASWGNREARSDAEKSELKAALIRAQKAGLLVVTAAGNDAIDQDNDKSPVYPAAYSGDLDNMIVVAATDSSNRLASFSNWGVNSVQIAAPGVKIFSTTPKAQFGSVTSVYNDEIVTYQATSTQNFEIDWNGTSMAAPFVAGAAALVWSKYPAENYLQIKNRILNAVRPVATLRGKVATGGVLDVSASLGLVSN